jgi:hypothetical protein
MNIGKIKKGETKEFIHVITNNTDKTVKVKLSPYCSSCTTASGYNTKLASKESTVATLKFTPTSSGKQVKFVGVDFDGKEIEKIMFEAEVYD